MKILINDTCISAEYLTGIERFARYISQELYRIDAGTEVVSTHPLPDVPSTGRLWPLEIANRFFGKREYLLRALWDQTFFRLRIAHSKPDVVYFPIQDGIFNPSVKQIVTVHDLHYLHFDTAMPECKQEIGLFRTKFYHYKMPRILEHSAAIIAVSESTKQDIMASFGIKPDKIHVVYNGYDELKFRVIDNPQPTLDRFGLQSGQYFFFVGSILKHKNIARLVQAFARLQSNNALVIAGVCKDSDCLDEIMNLAAYYGISNAQLRYLEYVADDDLPYLYNGALAFMLPSLHEGFGVPIIEAMACGTPVITSNCSAMPEVAGDAALQVDPYSVESITTAMRELIDNTQLVSTLRTAGLERAKMFRWSYSAQKLYNVCRMVCES